MRVIPWLAVATCAVGVLAVAPPARAAGTTEGRLVARRGNETVDVPLRHTDVHIRVDGNLADATVVQTFDDPYADPIDAVYLFPLPDHAAVTELTITVGDRTIRGAIHERAQAKRIYEAARDAGFTAALMTQERPNLFTQEVANLAPHAPIAVTIRYVEPLAYADGGYQLDFPMVAIPRHGGDASVTPTVLPPGTRGGRDIALAVDLDPGVTVESIASPSHRVVVTGNHVALAADDTIPDKDFTLRYTVAGAAPKLGVTSYRDGGDGSFVLVAQPPATTAAPPITPREVIFALDTSASMRGAPLAKAKQLVHRVVETLRADDTFQVVQFDDTASALGAAPIANKPRNVALALDWVDRLDAGGGTELATGIDVALAQPHDPARLRVVVLVTDGYVGNEDDILRDALAHAGAARLFAFGVGSAVNHWLLDELTEAGRGSVQYVRPDDDTRVAVDAFRARIDAPVITDLAIDWGGLAVSDVTPHALPDLFASQPLVIAGHYARGGSGVVTVRGKRDGRDVAFAVPVTLADRDASRPALAQVWARRRIAELERAQLRADDPARVRDLVAVSLAAHVLTRYTAFVAVDDHPAAAGRAARRVVVPVDIPEAVGYGFAIGTYGTIGHGYGAGDGYGVSGVSYGRADRYTEPVVVHVSEPVALGSLDKTILRRYIKRQTDSVRHCYEKQLAAKPSLRGTVTAHLLVDEDGHVVTSTADGMDDTVATCVAGVLGAIEFPKAEGAGTTQVNYPFTFEPNVIHEDVMP
jgi:Ca-activated chloride channel family protein